MTEQKAETTTKRTVEPMDLEILAMKRISKILNTLSGQQQERVIQWAAGKANEARYQGANIAKRLEVERLGNGFADRPHQ